MKKEDLKIGNVVKLRNGALCLIHPTNNYIDVSDIEDDIMFRNLIDGTLETKLCNVDSNLRNKLNFLGSDKYDIMKVYEDYTCQKVLWERIEKPELTEDEKVILRNLPKEYKYFARDKYKSLCVYIDKPKKESMYWFSEDFLDLKAFSHLFQFITWEDEEPYLISDLLEEE